MHFEVYIHKEKEGEGVGVLVILNLPSDAIYSINYLCFIILFYLSSKIIMWKVVKIYTLKYLDLKLKYKSKFSFNMETIESYQ